MSSHTKISHFFTSELSENEIENFLLKLKCTNIQNEHCLLWSGAQRNSYGILENRFRGNKIKIPVHRLAYFLKHNCEPLSPEMHVSHLCHNKLCINVEHLSLEPQAINNSRQICKNEGECYGHHGFQNCLI